MRLALDVVNFQKLKISLCNTIASVTTVFVAVYPNVTSHVIFRCLELIVGSTDHFKMSKNTFFQHFPCIIPDFHDFKRMKLIGFFENCIIFCNFFRSITFPRDNSNISLLKTQLLDYYSMEVLLRRELTVNKLQNTWNSMNMTSSKRNDILSKIHLNSMSWAFSKIV